MSDEEPRPEEESPSRRRRLLKRVAIGVAVLLVVVTTGFVVAYQRLEGNINVIDDTGLGAEKDRPAEVAAEGPRESLTVLVMGSDSREGSDIGGDTPGLSDTTMLLHVSANRERAFGISIPRDLMVERPTCEKDGETVPGGLTQFNAAYAVGGPLCTVRTVEAITNVRVDHFVVINFNGFKDMVDAVNGVKVCVPNEVNDDIGKIYLPAGTYTVTGNQALDYVRVRHGLGAENGDIGRMKRQQAFIASMIEKVMSAGTLANPVRLVRFLDAATKSLTTDRDFADLQQLASLGKSLQDIGLDNIRFLTVPNEPYEPDPNRLQLADGAEQLWTKVRNDQPLGRLGADALRPGDEESGTKTDAPSASPSDGSSPSASPSQDAQGSQDAAAERRRQAAEEAGLCV